MGNCASTGKHRFSASPDDIAVEMSSTQAAKEPPLCMIHGLMGCTMRKTGALAFIPVRAALGLPTPSLANFACSWRNPPCSPLSTPPSTSAT